MFVQFILLYLMLNFSTIPLNGQISVIHGLQVSDSQGNKLADVNKEKKSEESSTYSKKSKMGDILDKYVGSYMQLPSPIAADEIFPNIPWDSKQEEMARNKKKQKQYFYLSDFFTLNNLKESLKAITQAAGKQKTKKANRKDYRDIKVILEELGQYDFSKKTHENILKEFLINYTRSDMVNKVNMLTEIEFLVHQYSVAHDFVKLGGIEILLHDIATYRNTSFQALIAMTLGAAIQGNPPVKRVVFESNAIPLLLNLLESLDPVLQSRILFTISSLLRQYPEAQNKFIVEGGFGTLAYLSKTTQSAKILKKIMTLIYDLLCENKFDEEDARKLQNISLVTSTRLRKTQLEQTLRQNSFCDIFTNLITTDYSEAIETLVQTMPYLKDVCKKEFIKNISTLKTLAEKYHFEMDEKDFQTELSDDLHFSPLFTTLSKLISELELLHKDEL